MYYLFGLFTSSAFGLEAEVDEVLVHPQREVAALVVLVHVAQVVVLQVLADRLGGHRQIVVGNLREEQVVRNVAVGDVVVYVVDAVAESAIHGLEGSGDEGPVLVGVDQRLVVVVLQVGHGHQPPAEHHIGAQVVVRKGSQTAKEVHI